MTNNDSKRNFSSPLIDPDSYLIHNPLTGSNQTISKRIENLDDRVSIWMQGEVIKPSIRNAMKALTISGDGYLYFFIAALIAFADLSMGYDFTLLALIAFAIQIPLQKFIKHKYKRNRPFQEGKGINGFIAPPDRYSFPSGHTAGAVIIAYSLIQVLGFEILGITGILLIVAWAIGVGLSRIYLGMHYTSDVIAGALLGFGSIFFALLLI